MNRIQWLVFGFIFIFLGVFFANQRQFTYDNVIPAQTFGASIDGDSTPVTLVWNRFHMYYSLQTIFLALAGGFLFAACLEKDKG